MLRFVKERIWFWFLLFIQMMENRIVYWPGSSETRPWELYLVESKRDSRRCECKYRRETKIDQENTLHKLACMNIDRRKRIERTNWTRQQNELLSVHVVQDRDEAQTGDNGTAGERAAVTVGRESRRRRGRHNRETRGSEVARQ